MEIKKGQKVWICIYKRKTEISETTIKSVGRKYITTDHDDRIKFNRETLIEVDGRGYSSYLILDIEEYNTNNYYANIIFKLKKMDWGIDRVKLDEIAKILDLTVI